MSTKEKQGFALYFLFAFGLAWLCQVGGCRALLQQGNTALYQAALLATMCCPAVAVLLVCKVWQRQPTGIGWKPRLKGNVKYFLLAWFGPLVLTLAGMALYFAVFPSRLDTTGRYLAATAGEAVVQQMAQQGITPLNYFLISAAQAAVYAPFINMIPALGEEIGWRGYMMPRLKERFGLLTGRLLGGVLWGVWHWPLMLLVGYEYGTNYLGAPVLGLVVFCVFCFALNTFLDFLYEKTGCIWAPALAHGAVNAAGGLPILLMDPADAYYTILGPIPMGLISMLPFLAIAVALTLRQMKQEEKN